VVLILFATAHHDWIPRKAAQPLEVSIVRLPEESKPSISAQPPRQQIISEPASPISQPPPETQLRAERDHRAEREQIARGSENSATRGKAAPPTQIKQEKARQSAARRVANSEKIDRKTISPQPAKPELLQRNKQSSNQGENQKPSARPIGQSSPSKTELRLDPSSMLSRFATDQGGQKAKALSPAGSSSPASATTNDRLDAALSIATGAGSADNLSRVPDGSVTMLNAKADRFAVFVRRVAYRVFATLRETGWQSLSASHIRAIGRPVIVIAELTPAGRVISTTIQQPSGSSRFDGLVESAVKRSVSDPNPPEGALAADGRIRFIFQSRSTVSVAPSGGQGGLSERRWLELGTGLD
jgi:TonB family protein